MIRPEPRHREKMQAGRFLPERVRMGSCRCVWAVKLSASQGAASQFDRGANFSLADMKKEVASVPLSG